MKAAAGFKSNRLSLSDHSAAARRTEEQHALPAKKSSSIFETDKGSM